MSRSQLSLSKEVVEGYDCNWDDKTAFVQFLPIEQGLSSQLNLFVIINLASLAS